MSTPTPDFPLGLLAPVDQVFPKLTPEHVARVAAHGRPRPVHSGEILLSAGDEPESIFVIAAGSIELVRRSRDGEETFATLRPRQFTGETNMLSETGLSSGCAGATTRRGPSRRTTSGTSSR